MIDEVRDSGPGEGAADEWILPLTRASVSDGLVATGMTRLAADMWCDLWELQRAGDTTPRAAGYWHAGRRWIKTQQDAGQQPETE
jgi:hypothetical protein